MQLRNNRPDFRHQDPAFEAQVKAETARMQGILDERARLEEQAQERRLQESEKRVRETILRDVELIEAGRLRLHCGVCLEGFAAARLRDRGADLARFCEVGRQILLGRTTPQLDLGQEFALLERYQ